MKMAELSKAVRERDKHCQWPHCMFPIGVTNPLECAHLEHRGMGGSKDANRLNNAVLLCKTHHDILDGRTVGGRKYEVRFLLRQYLLHTGVIKP